MRNSSFVIFSFLFLFVAAIAVAEVKEYRVKDGEVVSSTIQVTPGFAVLIEVPMDILSYALADSNIFSCMKNPPAFNKILCKPLTTQMFSTNLVVVTEKNEFNFVLKIDSLTSENSFKYVFYNDQSKSEKSTLANKTQMARSEENFLEGFLKDFSYRKCSQEYSNPYVKVECLEVIHFLNDIFVKFKVESRLKSVFTIINCSFLVKNLGGFTGLVLKSSSPLKTEYSLQSTSLHFGEETIGVVKYPQITLQENQRLSFVIHTDSKESGEIEVGKFL